MTLSSMQTLGTPEADERRKLLLAAVDASPVDSIDVVVDSLGDDDWRVRKEAIGQVARVPSALLVPRLVEAIAQGENVGLRNAAIEAVGVLGEDAVAALASAFDSRTGAQRRFLVAALGSTGSLAASDVLVRACDDPDENLVAAAIDALARVGGPKAEAAILRRLHDPESFRRMAALDALDRLGASVAFEELEPVLDDPVVRRAAFAVLGRTRSPRAVPLLFEALSERSVSQQGLAAVALEHLSESSDEVAEHVAAEATTLGAGPRAALRRLLAHGDAPTRRASALLLLLARDDGSVPEVLELAADVSLSTGSLSAFGTWGTDAIPALLETVDRATGVARALALELAADLLAQGPGLASPEVASAVQARVRASLASVDEATREAAVRSFTASATLDDLPALVALARTARTEDALRAASSIERFVDADPVAVDAALLGVDVSEGGGALCSVLARLATTSSIERIVTCISSQDPRARRAAVLALGEASGQHAVETLALTLADEDVDVRATAAMMLGRVRDAEGRAVGAERLLSAIGHDSPVVQMAAMLALVDLGELRARDKIASLVTSSDPGVAAAAIGALRALGDERTLELALGASRAGEPEIRIAALAVLADRDVPEHAVPFVREMLADPAWEVRLAAIDVARLTPEGAAWLRERRALETEDLVLRALDRALEGEAP